MKTELNHSLFMQHENSLFASYAQILGPGLLKKNNIVAFRDHPQFAKLVNILARRSTHHIFIRNNFSAIVQKSLLTGFLITLQHETVPISLRHAEIMLFDVEKLNEMGEENFASDLNYLKEYIEFSPQCKILAFNSSRILNQVNKKFLELCKLLNHPNCRFIIFSSKADIQFPSEDLFDVISINRPTERDDLLILKQEKVELEAFHQISIPDDLLPLAYKLTERYLSAEFPLDKCLLLLDSASARATTLEWDRVNQFRPALNITILFEILSAWTQIPINLLQLQKFKLNEFIDGMQQKIFGQETAIQLISQQLFQAQSLLHQENKPYAAFHFIGPKYTGKRKTALLIAELIYQQFNILFFADNVATHQDSLLKLKFYRAIDYATFSLEEIFNQLPYPILFLEFTETISRKIQEELYEILSKGILTTDIAHINFKQCILIVSSNFGKDALQEYASRVAPHEDEQKLDLMQLISSHKKSIPGEPLKLLSHDVMEDIQLELNRMLLAPLNELLTIIPFIPLSKNAIDKIIHLKLNQLAKLLQIRYGIELGYAPEVIHYLSNEMALREQLTEREISIDLVFKQLYFVTEQAIMNQMDNKNRPNQLFLQLNETGQLLRCDWVTFSNIRQHNVT